MISIRLAMKEDFAFFYELKSEDFNIFWTGGETEPEIDSLRDFFYKVVDDAQKSGVRKIYIIENEDEVKVGHLYIIPKGDEYDLAVAIRQKFCGRGYAKQEINLGLKEGRRLGFKRMVGSI